MMKVFLFGAVVGLMMMVFLIALFVAAGADDTQRIWTVIAITSLLAAWIGSSAVSEKDFL